VYSLTLGPAERKTISAPRQERHERIYQLNADKFFVAGPFLLGALFGVLPCLSTSRWACCQAG